MATVSCLPVTVKKRFLNEIQVLFGFCLSCRISRWWLLDIVEFSDPQNCAVV